MRDQDFFIFNRYKDKRINQIITDENLSIGTMVYETWLGADIVFERQNDKSWNFTLYRRTRGTPLEIMLVIAALVSIRRRTNSWFKSTEKPFKIHVRDFLLELNIKDPKEIELAEDVLYLVKNGIDYAFETKYALDKGYLTVDEVFDLSKYYQQMSISLDIAFQFLASMAALRKSGNDVSEFHNLLIQKKKYEMLQIIDAIETNLDNTAVSFAEVKKIFNLMYPNVNRMKKDISEISDKVLADHTTDKIVYHVALSFAGEDRKIAEKIAKELADSGYEVFYDDYERAELWGKDLYVHLNDLYSKYSKYCLMIISKNYADKLWTNHERRAAQAKAFKQNQEYILPLRLDETEIPGINDTIGYVDYNKTPFSELISLIKQKLNK